MVLRGAISFPPSLEDPGKRSYRHNNGQMAFFLFSIAEGKLMRL